MSDSGGIGAQKSPDWLPDGWTVEVRSRNGKNIKSYIHHQTGYKFYSKPKVLQFLGTTKNNNQTPQKETASEKINGTAGSFPNGGVTETPQGNGAHSGESDKIGASETLQSEEMNADKSEDWLPAGWIVEVKVKNGRTVKTYVDPLWGHRFPSKPKVLQYLGNLTNTSCTVQNETEDSNSEKNLPEKANRTPEPLPQISTLTTPLKKGSRSKTTNSTKSLPDGWITEIVPRKSGSRAGYPDKQYIDPVTGRKFSSMQRVFEYIAKKKTIADSVSNLNEDKTEGVTPAVQLVESQNVKTFYDTINSPTSKKRSSRQNLGRKTNVDESGWGTPPSQLMESQNMKALNNTDYSSISKETSSNEQHSKKIGMEQLSPEGLPPGWIKKITTKKSANRKRNVSHFIDPVSGYVFTSQKDAWRYFESRDINKCIKKPKIMGEKGSATEGSYLPLKKTDSTKLLPDGWITEIKPRKKSGSRSRYPDKQYIDPVTGRVFFSKQKVFEYLGIVNPSSSISKQKETLNEDKAEGVSSPTQLVKSQNTEAVDNTFLSSTSRERSHRKRLGRKINIDESGGGTPPSQLVLSEQPEKKLLPKELPPGWIKEVKTRNKANRRRNVSYFIDPVSGYVFTSLVDAWRYLEAGDISKCVKKPKKREEMGFDREQKSPKMNIAGTKTPLKQQSGIEIVIERVTSEGLPPGWIKEIRIQKKADGIRKEAFYTDPVSGYVLSSQKDVFRFVETGDIRYCTSRPRNRDQLGLNQGNSAASPPVVHDTTEKQVSTGANIGSIRNLEAMDSDVPQKLRPIRSAVKSPAVMQKLEHGTPKEQLSTSNNISFKRSLETTGTNASPKRKRTRASAKAVTAKIPIVELPNSRLNEQNLKVNVGNSGENQTLSQDEPLDQFGEENWSNPCLDFAIKTLNGTLPFEDNAPAQNIFKTDYNCSILSDFGEPNVTKVNNSIGSEAPVNSENVTQSANDPIFLRDMNCTLPSGSKTAPLQEEIKDGDEDKLTINNYARFLF